MSGRKQKNTDWGRWLLPYRERLKVACSESVFMERIGFRAGDAGYRPPIIRITKKGNREVFLYPADFGERGGYTDLFIAIDITKLEESGEIGVCCWRKQGRTIFLMFLTLFILAFELFGLYELLLVWPTQWYMFIVFPLVDIFAYGILFLDVREGRSKVEQMIREYESPF